MAKPHAKIGGNAYQGDACLDDLEILPRSGVRSSTACVSVSIIVEDLLLEAMTFEQKKRRERGSFVKCETEMDGGFKWRSLVRPGICGQHGGCARGA